MITTAESKAQGAGLENLTANSIREEDFPLDPQKRLDPKIEKMIAAKSVMRWDAFHNYWKAKLQHGKVCWDAVTGKIFDDWEKQRYKDTERMVISVPELVPVLDALEGMQVAGMREGIIVPMDGDDAPPVELIGSMLKKHDELDELPLEFSAMFRDGMVTGFPSCMWFDRSWDETMQKKLDRWHPPWDSVLPDPSSVRRGFVDCEEAIRLGLSKRDTLIAMYPNRESQIRAAFPNGGEADKNLLGSDWTESTRNTLFNQVQSGSEQFRATGFIYHFERVFMVRKKITVYVNPNMTDKVEVLPQEWSQAEVNRWKEFNPEWKAVEKMVKVCWVTAATSTGLLLENRRHWFQEGELPCSWYIPRLFNNQSYGFVEFLLGNLKGVNAARIEWLHSLRLANDNLMITKEGAIANADTAINEKAKPSGLIVVKSDYSIGEAVQFPQNRREQMGWTDLEHNFLDGIRRLSVNENVTGAAQSSQESGKLVDRRITQNMTKYTPHMSSLNSTKMDITRKTLKSLKYIHTEEEMVRYVDANKQPQQAIINKQEDYSWVAPSAARVKYDICGSSYDYIAAEGDNSITAREHELSVFNEILERLARLPDMTMWPMLLSSYPNRIAQMAATKIQDSLDAQSQAPQTDNIKLSLAGTPDDLLHNPYFIAILKQKGVTLPETPAASSQQSTVPMDDGSAPPGVPAPEQQAALQP